MEVARLHHIWMNCKDADECTHLKFIVLGRNGANFVSRSTKLVFIVAISFNLIILEIIVKFP